MKPTQRLKELLRLKKGTDLFSCSNFRLKKGTDLFSCSNFMSLVKF